jgi:MurNAc alpha-1-phosphate uridylyltransferase
MPALALLAGGLATRLRPITATIPKSIVTVAGKPFIAHQLSLLAQQSITDVVICTGYLAEQIESYVGDGSRFGVRVHYSQDGDKPLGTGGALRRALPMLGERFMVMYGDSYLRTSFRPVYAAFRASGRPALMTVYRNANKIEQSNVEFVDGTVRRYDKVHHTSAMLHIDYGLGVLDASALSARPTEVAFDLADLYQDLANRGLLGGYEVSERFYEIGSPAGLAETDALLQMNKD